MTERLPDTPELAAAYDLLRQIYWREYGRGWREAVLHAKEIAEREAVAVGEAKCTYCGSPPHQGVCPSVKAFEYHPDGSVKRVEFKPPADYLSPFPLPNWNDPKLTAAAAPDLSKCYTVDGNGQIVR